MRYHLGCGGDIKPGYVNVDMYSAKAQVREDLLTMKYQPSSHIESHHVFEHFTYVNSLVLLVKWSMALKMGGTLQVDIPDVERLAAALPGAGLAMQRGIMRLIFGSHEAGWAYHINGWTEPMFRETIKYFGLDMVSTRRYGGPQSDFPHMGMEFLARKVRQETKEHMVNSACAMLANYTHPNEHQLRALFQQQMRQGI